MIRFQFDRLSPGMCFVLSWLIDRGGAMSYAGLLASIRPAAKAEWRIVSRATVRGLLNRGYLEESDDLTRVQVSGYAVRAATTIDDRNPPVLPILRARAEALARRESATRVADTIRDWRGRSGE